MYLRNEVSAMLHTSTAYDFIKISEVTPKTVLKVELFLYLSTISLKRSKVEVNLNLFLISALDGGARSSVVGWGTMLQARRSAFRFPMRLLDFLNLPNPSCRGRLNM
jgi:hypothetical protein